MKKEDFGIYLIVGVICFISGAIFTHFYHDSVWKKMSVKHGAAHYVTDYETGNIKWEWKKLPENKN